MRFLVSVMPAAGHWQPVAAIARSLRAAGHEVLIAAAPSLRPSADREFTFVAVGPDYLGTDPWWQGHSVTLGPYGKVLDGVPLELRWPEFVVNRLAPGLVQEIVDLIGDFGPDVLVADSQEAVGPLAATMAGLPYATVGATYLSSDRDFVSDSLRAAYGLPLGRRFPFLVLERTPPSLRSEPLAAVAPTAHAIRPVVADDAAPKHGPAELPAGFGRRPVVYASLGTTFSDAPILQAMVHGLGGGRYDVLVTTSARDPASLGAMPEGVTAVPYLPQSRILDRADAAVIHGGYNSVMGALARGVPLVVIPLGADHFYNAHQVAACGAGIIVKGQDVSPGAIADAVQTLLGEPGYREAAMSLAAEISGMPGPDHAVDLLDRLARQRAPVLATTG